MISVTFTSDIENITCNTNVYQWDNKRNLEIKGLTFSDTPAVHFANKMSKNAIVVEPTIANGVMIADIPNSLLCEPHHIIAYVYSLDDNQCKTVKTVFIPLEKRPKPDDFVFEGNAGIIALTEINAKVDALIVSTNAYYDAYVQAKDVELDGFMNDKTTQINNFIASQNADREAYQNQLNAQFESFQNNVASSHNHDDRYYTESEMDARVVENLGTISNHYVWHKIKSDTVYTVKKTSVTVELAVGSSSPNYYLKMTYGKNYSIGTNGQITVTETFTPSTNVGSSGVTYWTSMMPFYYYSPVDGKTYEITSHNSSDNTTSYFNGSTLTTTGTTGTVDGGYVNSANPNAYPINDGWTYEAEGKLGGGTEIVSGKYTGTGSTSWHNINLGTQPLAVFIKNAENNTSTQMLFCTRTNDAYDVSVKTTQASITSTGFRVRQATDSYDGSKKGFANAIADHWYLAIMEA